MSDNVFLVRNVQFSLQYFFILLQKQFSLQNMEKSKTSFTVYDTATSTPDILRMFQNIIINFTNSKNQISSPYRKHSKLPSYIFDPHQPNPQQQQLTDKYVEKLRHTSKAHQKQLIIRNSQLGQKVIFTDEQLMKLEIIDQIFQKGYKPLDDPFKIELYPTVNIEEQDLYSCFKQSVQQNPFSGQLERFEEWGRYGNKENMLGIVDEYGRQCLENIDTKQLLKQKGREKKRDMKLVNFRKNHRSRSNYKNPAKRIRERPSIKLMEQKSFKIPTISPQIISQFQTQKYIKLVNRKKFPSLDKDLSNNNKMGPRMFKKMFTKQKISKLANNINGKYLKIPVKGYMTPERLQALYNCEMMKGAKQVMNSKDYVNLRVEMIDPNSQQVKSNQNMDIANTLMAKVLKQHGLEKPHEEIEIALQENLMRLKKQKQRVIEKLRC